MEEIIFLDSDTLGQLEEIQSLRIFGNLTLYHNSNYNETLDRVKTCTILLTNKVVIDAQIIDNAVNLKLICVTATGMNNVNLEYAAKKNIVVKNVSGYSTASVTQVTFGNLFYLMNHLPYFDNFVKSGQYSSGGLFTNTSLSFHEIQGKKFGIIGLGTIGTAVAKIAKAFGANIIYYSTSGKNTNDEFEQVSLDKLLNECDIISIHAPLNDNTKNLIDYAKLSLMKPTAIILNTGRGGIINESDLAKALNENIIGAASIDVMDQEPLPANSTLLHLKNKNKILITPHIAWASLESRQRLIRQTCLNIKNFLNKSN